MFIKPICAIYEIKNNLNGKSYIGQTNDFERRIKEHKSRYIDNSEKSERSYLYRAFRKYGIDNFSFKIIQECDVEELNSLEIKYIKEKNTFYDGYNMTLGGQNDYPNKKITQEDVIYLRKLYDSQTILTNKQIWEENFKDKITFNYFRNLWQGATWSNIMPEVFTEENKKYYLSKHGTKRNFTDEEVIKIRTEYIVKGPQFLYMKYGRGRVSFSAFEKMLRGPNYNHLPLKKDLKNNSSE